MIESWPNRPLIKGKFGHGTSRVFVLYFVVSSPTITACRRKSDRPCSKKLKIKKTFLLLPIISQQSESNDQKIFLSAVCLSRDIFYCFLRHKGVLFSLPGLCLITGVRPMVKGC